MTRVVTVLLAALVASTAGLVAAPPASAVSSTLAFEISGSLTMPTPLGTDSTGPCVDDATSGSYLYDVVRIKPTASGSYTITEDGLSADGRLGIYTGAFDPVAQLTNCLAFIDENTSSPFSVALTGGATYTLVRSAGVSGGSGEYTFNVDGPGTLTVLTSTTTTLTTNPNPSELSKATVLKAVVAGGATPAGSVQFKDGAVALGSAPVVGGIAQLSVKTLGVGDHTLSATYSGDATHDVSADTHVHKVKFGPKPKVKLSVSDKQVAVGRKVRLSWVTTNADKVKASGDWHGKKAKKGHTRVRIRTLGVHIFKLRVSNVNGVDRAKVKVVAVRAPKKFTVSAPDDILTAGTKVRIKAVKLDAKERFKVFLDDELLGKGFADARGLASALVTIPKDTKEGEHVVQVMGSNEDRLGVLDIQVVAATKELDVELAKDTVKINKTNTVTVSGLVEGEDVTVMYQGDVLTEGVANADGEFEYTFPVGSEAGPGNVDVIGQVPGRKGEASFQVVGSGGTGL